MRKNGRKLLSLALALVMVLGMVPAALAAEPTSGKCGDNLTWSLQNGTLTISGTGAMPSYIYDVNDAPWVAWSTAITTVVINDGVTSIGRSAFYECTGLTSVAIPGSVTNIGAFAFCECTGLTSVTLGSGLTHIEESAFAGCSSLTQISIPDNGVNIAEAAFDRCGLTSVTIPGSTVLPDADPQSVEGAFSNCPNLANVTIQDGVSSIGIYAFMNSGLTSITIPSSVSGIGAAAFDGCDGLKDVYFIGTEAQWKAIAIGQWNDPLLNAAIHCSGTAPVQPAPAIQFSDVKDSDYYHDAVYWAVANDIVNGTSPTTFTPDRTCTATEILTLLWRAAGQPESKAQLPFTVNAGLEYAEGALRWALEKGMIDKSFDQTAPCTRASAVKYIWQAAGSPATAVANSFTDVAANADYAPAVAWAVSRGIVNGTSPTTFSPNDTCTRAQIVTLLHRTYK